MFNTADLAEATGLTGVGQIIQQPLYDTSEMAAASTNMSFFTRQVGQQLPISAADKTGVHTNMDTSGALPAGVSFSIHSIQVAIADEFGTLGDLPAVILHALRYETVFRLVVGDKEYLEIPVRMLASGMGVSINNMIDAAAAPIQEEYGQMGTADPTAIFRLATPIVLSPSQSFNATILFQNAPAALTATQQVICVLGGFLQRPVQ